MQIAPPPCDERHPTYHNFHEKIKKWNNGYSNRNGLAQCYLTLIPEQEPSWPKMSSSSYVKIKADIDSIYLEDKDDEAVPSQ